MSIPSYERTRIWHEKFMALAFHIAEWSKDPKRKVGAVVVTPDRRNFACGYNGFTRRFLDTEERLHDQEFKNRFMVHAERNALDNAKFGMRGTTLYSTKFPCLECMKGIIQTGVEQLVAPAPVFDHPRWGQSHRDSDQLMKETSIKYHRLDAVAKPIEIDKARIQSMLKTAFQKTISGHADDCRSLIQDIGAELGLEI